MRPKAIGRSLRTTVASSGRIRFSSDAPASRLLPYDVPMASRGELEQRVMELLWESPVPRSVAEVHAAMSEERELAYTTVMTVLDRLAKKGMARRELVNRAWQYEPADPQHVVVAREMGALLHGLTPEVRRRTISELAKAFSDDERAALSGATAAAPSALPSA
jgi:predicted transcriptional regulator